MTDAGATIGQLLKAERERRGMSPQKAADELHLDAWVVDALEADDYERVGPSVYVKGHLKRYAALLGLSPGDIMAGYESRAQSPNTAVSQAANVRLRTDAPAVSNLPWTPLLASLAVALLVLGVVWWKPWQQRGAGVIVERQLAETRGAASADTADGSGTAGGSGTGGGSGTADTAGRASGSAADGTPLNSAAASPSAQAAAPSLPAASAPASIPTSMPGGPARVAEQTAAAAAGTGRTRLRLSFSADSWVDVQDAEGNRAFAGKGRANSVKTIAGIAPMRVYLGFASGVQLEINNRAVAIGPQFMAGDVARFEAGADGVLRRDSHSVVPPTVQSRNSRPTG